ncbi:hypothetical protein KR018_006497 [Drosophila ironensis]|nr:hypothetical protein KR018_006497 [Drosophila ironensis]
MSKKVNDRVHSGRELVLLNDFRKKFMKEQENTDAVTREIHVARDEIFMHQYRLLIDLEPSVNQRLQIMTMFYALMDTGDTDKTKPPDQLKMIDQLMSQAEKTLEMNATTPLRASKSIVDLFLVSNKPILVSDAEKYLEIEDPRSFWPKKAIALIQIPKHTKPAELDSNIPVKQHFYKTHAQVKEEQEELLSVNGDELSPVSRNDDFKNLFEAFFSNGDGEEHDLDADDEDLDAKEPTKKN